MPTARQGDAIAATFPAGLRALWAAVIAALLTGATGCQFGGPLPEPARAVWVSRVTYESPDDVRRVVRNCRDAGFNTVLFQVRGNATAYYDSPYEPWAEAYDFQSPGFDPLAVAIDEARARGVDLHAWVNVMPAWRGEDPPSDPTQLYNARPEWFWYDQYGNRQKLSSFYVSLNPCLPEVREYLVAVFRDVVTRYDVDGLHLDYIRFPNEPPATPRDTDIDYPRDARTVALFKADTGKTPDGDPEAWDDWRAAQLTELVAMIRAAVTEADPDAALTAAVSSVPGRGARYHQDSAAWLERNLVDALILMNYTDDPEVFAERNANWLGIDTAARVIPGLWFGRHRESTPTEATAAVEAMFKLAQAQTGDVCVFSYWSLFALEETYDADSDAAVIAGMAADDPSAAERRALRRQMLLPVTRWVP
jgi:uncharacterized lipoprotein YddW (UPF0748 family)